MLVTSQVLNSIRVTFSAVFNKAFADTETVYEKFTSVIPSSSASNKYGWLGSIPFMRKWIGEREIQKVTENDYTIKNEKFESTIGIMRDDIDDDNLGIYRVQVELLASNAKLHAQERSFERVIKGFVEKCYDGNPFFSSNHKVGDKTYSNTSTLKLSPASYGAARASMRNIKDENGKSLNIKPNLLVVPPTLEEDAHLLLTADQIDGTSNPWKGSAELLVSSEISNDANPDNWFLFDTSRPVKPIIFQERKPAKFTSLTKDTDENVFMRDEFLYGVDSRDGSGYGFWQMAFGSTGHTAG